MHGVSYQLTLMHMSLFEAKSTWQIVRPVYQINWTYPKSPCLLIITGHIALRKTILYSHLSAQKKNQLYFPRMRTNVRLLIFFLRVLYST